MTIKNGDVVKVEYEGSFENGEVFDASSKHGAPLEFTVGNNNVVKGFDDAMVGMKLDEEKEIVIPPEQGYGMPREDLIKDIPRDKIPPGDEAKVGAMLLLSLPNGNKVPARIAEISDKEAKIDLNHPLAGKTLKFKVKVVSIEEKK